MVVSAALFGAACGGGSGNGEQQPASAPVAAFTVSPPDGMAPLPVVLDAGSSQAGADPLTDFSWNFGDGESPAVGEVVTRTFEEAGDYEVVLTVTDAGGRTATRRSTVSVSLPTGTFTLSGRISVLASSAIDSDVNDESTDQIPNNSFAEAQLLPNPVTLGGYINRPGAGPPGPLQATGDPGDFYRIDLNADDVVMLSVAHPDTAEITMQLWDDDETLVESVTAGGMYHDPDDESRQGTVLLRAPEDGSFFVGISAEDGASNYVLSIAPGMALSGAAEALLGDGAVRLSDDFVPGEWIVIDGDGPRARTRLQRLQAGQHGAAGAGGGGIRQQLRQRGAGLREGRVSSQHWDKLETMAAIRQFNREHRGRRGLRAEPNFIRRPTLATNDPFIRYQWHYQNIELPAAWQLTEGSGDVVVAVVDTGVLLRHPDLRNTDGTADRLLPGRNFISNADRSGTGATIDPSPDDPGDQAFQGRSSFHGTHVAGTIGARTGNAVGVAGVGWHTRIMPLRVRGVGGGSSFDLIEAIRYAAGLDNASGTLPERPADVINLSLGGGSSSQAERDALQAARDAGVIVVAAAGNLASSRPFFPAAYPGVLAVSATTITRALAPYSNFGPNIDLAAPGGNNQTDINADGIGDGVVSTTGDDSSGDIRFGYASLNGTSMAAPHVSGVIALMKAVHPELTPDQFDALLQTGALTDDLGAPGRDDQFGYGQINARKAVTAALGLVQDGGGEVAPLLSGDSSNINLGGFASERELELRNVGGGSLTVSGMESNRLWLTVEPVDVSENSFLGTYKISVDRDAIKEDGTHLGTVRFLSDANTFNVSVLVQKFEASFAGDAGLHHVVLVDKDNNPVASTMTSLDDDYRFQLRNVPPDLYRLYAGTDNDMDGYICDAGEACGAFPTLDAPEIIVVNRNIGGLNFTSGFPSRLINPQQQSEAGSDNHTLPETIPIERGTPDGYRERAP